MPLMLHEVWFLITIFTLCGGFWGFVFGISVGRNTRQSLER